VGGPDMAKTKTNNYLPRFISTKDNSSGSNNTNDLSTLVVAKPAPAAPPHKNKHFWAQAPYFAGLLPFSIVAAPSKRVEKQGLSLVNTISGTRGLFTVSAIKLMTNKMKDLSNLKNLSNQTRFYSTNRKAKKVYNNADIEKEQIISNNNGKAGIYMFKNLVNKKRYVGSSVNIRRRMLEYFNINYLESKKYMPICRALLLYGYSNFSLEILEYCEPSDVISREQYYLDLLKPECNILKTAGSSLGFKQSEETKTKMSAGFANKKGLNNPLFGKTLLRTEVFDFNSNTNKVSKVKYYSTFSPARKNNTHLSVRQVYSNFGFINLNLNNTGFYENEKHHFGSYLAGLLEGEGHIYINKNGSKVKNYSLSITFNLKDLPLAEYLKDVIGFG
jgi:group I intron endonuclease